MNYLWYFLIFLLVLFLIWFFWKWKNRAILITHSGDYHLDDVFSTAVLTLLLRKKGKWFQLIRTRDKNIFQKWRKERDEKNREVYIYDVGLIYDSEKNEFDHHQLGGAGKRENGIEYSSAGLVWKKFGLEISNSEYIFKKIDENFVSPIDALDNGQNIYDKKYSFREFSLSDLIRLFAPKKRTDKKMKKSFLKSVSLVRFVLLKMIEKEKKNEKSIEKLREIFEASDDKRLLIVEDEKVNTDLVTELFPEVLFIVKKQKEDVWSIKTVRKELGDFLARKYLPKRWAGLEAEDLDKVTGLQGGIFCHRARFLASAKNKETAVKMASLALNSEK